MLLKSKQANEDLENIWLQIALDKPIVADKFIDKILDVLDLIVISPYIGRVFNSVSNKYSSLRIFPFHNYLIFYEPIVDGVKIYRILHGSMDYSLDDLSDVF